MFIHQLRSIIQDLNCIETDNIDGLALECDRYMVNALQWRHNERDGVSNHQPHDCLLDRLFGRNSMKTSQLRVTGLCPRWIPHIMVSNAENVSIMALFSHVCLALSHGYITASIASLVWGHYRVLHVDSNVAHSNTMSRTQGTINPVILMTLCSRVTRRHRLYCG